MNSRDLRDPDRCGRTSQLLSALKKNVVCGLAQPGERPPADIEFVIFPTIEFLSLVSAPNIVHKPDLRRQVTSRRELERTATLERELTKNLANQSEYFADAEEKTM